MDLKLGVGNIWRLPCNLFKDPQGPEPQFGNRCNTLYMAYDNNNLMIHW